MDPDARDDRGWTALMHAANKGHAQLVPPLIEAGAELNVQAPDGATALFIAALHGHTEIIGYLMEAKCRRVDPGTEAAGRRAILATGAVSAMRRRRAATARASAVQALIQGVTIADAEGNAGTMRIRARFSATAKRVRMMVVVQAGTFMMGFARFRRGPV